MPFDYNLPMKPVMYFIKLYGILFYLYNNEHLTGISYFRDWWLKYKFLLPLMNADYLLSSLIAIITEQLKQH